MGRSNLFLFLALLTGAVGFMVSTKPRGIRNNNPGNIEYAPANDWKGQTGSDGRYAVFSDPVWGIRALAKLLTNYQNRYGLTTIREIISRWAPATENDTASYIASVSQSLGVGPETNLNLSSKRVLSALVQAIIRHENGVQPYPDELITGALDLV